MRASEILRRLADVIDAKETGGEGTTIVNRPGQEEVAQGQPTDTAGIEGQAQVNVKTMVPPLQQKLDLMKHLAGITSTGVEGGAEPEVCEICGATPCGCEGPEDELAVMKQNAGIKPTVIALADEDEPTEG
jgi:hypothetical protein